LRFGVVYENLSESNIQSDMLQLGAKKVILVGNNHRKFAVLESVQVSIPSQGGMNYAASMHARSEVCRTAAVEVVRSPLGC